MSDGIPLAPPAQEDLDPAPEAKANIVEISEAVKATIDRVGGAIEAGRKPGMPLNIVSNVVREAPLGSLFLAFLLGVVIARRR